MVAHRRSVGEGPTRSLLLVSGGRRLLVEALAAVVRSEPAAGLRLRAEPVHDVVDAVRVCGRTHPDVVVIDVDGMSPSRTIDLVERMKARSPRSRIWILFASANDRDRLILDCEKAGADGFLDRSSTIDVLLGSLRMTERVQVLPDGDVSDVLRRVARDRDGMRKAVDLSRSLTEREMEILGLMARALGNEAIAKELHVSARTVAAHVQNIYRKMGVHSRLQAVAMANRKGVTRLEGPFDPFPGEPSEVG
jgi:DNA-binding NarL/FixJ family response regulator